MNPIDTRPSTVIALAFATFDAGARVLIATRLDESVLGAFVAFPAVFVVAFLLLSTARAARPDGLSIATPVVALATIGDVVAARLTHGDLNLIGPPLFAMLALVLTLAIVPDTSYLKRIGAPLGFVGAVLIALPLVPGLGVSHGGQLAWIELGGYEGSPGEAGRVLVLIGFAAALCSLPSIDHTQPLWPQLAPWVKRALIIPTLAVGTHLLEQDYGPALLLALALAGTFATAARRLRWFVIALGATSVMLGLASFASEKVNDRVQDFIHPFHQVGGFYDQAALAHLSLAWAGWHGVGFGGGRAGAIPLASTDYVLAEWSLESGLIGLLVTMALFVWMLDTAWRWTMLANEGFPRLMATGLSWLLTVLTVWTTGAVVGFLPLSGLPSPFIASGGSNAAALGVVVALLIRTHPRTAPDPAARDASSALRRTRLAAMFALVVLALLVVQRVDSQRVELNRRADNPFRKWASLQRGPIITRDGTTVAYTTGGGSLDTIRRHYRAKTALGGLVGSLTELDLNGGGTELAWRALLRCGGSGQARPAGAAWSRGATTVIGNPADCETEGLRMSVDVGLQRAAWRALGSHKGAIVVLDARTGRVLAAVGRRRFEDGPGSIAAFEMTIAPASTFKIVTAAAALHHGVSTQTPLASGYTPPGGRRIRNAGGAVCGGTLAAAFAASCNSSFTLLGSAVGRERLSAMAARFGFGDMTRVSGFPVRPSSTGIKPGADAITSASIGQGTVLATPLQMAVAAAAIANRGMRPTPTLVDATCSGHRVPVLRRRAATLAVARELRAAMRAVTVSGTGRGASTTRGKWALKTGTAEVPALREAGTPRGTAGWIVGFPTELGSRVIPVIAGVVLPSDAHPYRSGQDGVAIINALSGAARSLGAPAGPCR